VRVVNNGNPKPGAEKLPSKPILVRRNGFIHLFCFENLLYYILFFFILNFDFDPSLNLTGSPEPQFGIL
jgi:hypothetical protein